MKWPVLKTHQGTWHTELRVTILNLSHRTTKTNGLVGPRLYFVRKTDERREKRRKRPWLWLLSWTLLFSYRNGDIPLGTQIIWPEHSINKILQYCRDLVSELQTLYQENFANDDYINPTPTQGYGNIVSKIILVNGALRIEEALGRSTQLKSLNSSNLLLKFNRYWISVIYSHTPLDTPNLVWVSVFWRNA